MQNIKQRISRLFCIFYVSDEFSCQYAYVTIWLNISFVNEPRIFKNILISESTVKNAFKSGKLGRIFTKIRK